MGPVTHLRSWLGRTAKPACAKYPKTATTTPNRKKVTCTACKGLAA